MRLIKDTILFTTREVPKWNPMNVCSYHLQEAGATPVQELAYALATAIAVLDGVKASGEVKGRDFEEVVGRISFFVNAGLRFITEICKMRAFTELWDEIARERYGVTNEKHRRFRYGVQVNSLGLTEQQPENNVYRILLEMLAVTLSKNARARAVQLPAWNEALGLPRPWDQQWSIRMQQIVAFETDLLDFGDIFDGSKEIERKVEELKREAREELSRIEEMGGAVAAVESSYMKQKLVESNTRRLEAIERGEQTVVGVNRFTETEPSPLTTGEGAILTVPEHVEREQVERLKAWRAQRDQKKVAAALDALRRAAQEETNIMPASIAAAKAGAPPASGVRRCARCSASTVRDRSRTIRACRRRRSRRGARRSREGVEETRAASQVSGRQAGARRPLQRRRADRGACARCGHGSRLRRHPAHARRNRQRRVGRRRACRRPFDPFRLARAAGARRDERMRSEGLDVPVIVGGIIPPEDENVLKQCGVAAVYTPKNYELNRILSDIVRVVDASASKAA